MADAEGALAPDAIVQLKWTRPDGTTATQQTRTNIKDVATFRTSGSKGTYTLTVIDVQRDGYTFDSSSSVLSRIVTIR